LSNSITKKDKEDWKNFLSSNEKLKDKDKIFERKNIEKKNTIDLHGFTLAEANTKIENFINESYQKGFNKLIIVTGKGLHSKNQNDPYVSSDLGILKNSIPHFIKNNENLMKKIIEIKDADINDGGSGAFYIYLRKVK
tara:strand:+ start:6347 stop:6760 length:414 start_codon:yes stop_codon:yes gene_type:complete